MIPTGVIKAFASRLCSRGEKNGELLGVDKTRWKLWTVVPGIIHG